MNTRVNKALSKTKQTGFSLFELLIAMMIGLFLLTGIATSFVSSKKASVSRDQLSVLEDNGRLALEIISKTIEHAGYTPITNASALPENIISNTSDIVSGTCTGGDSNLVNSALFTTSRVTNDNAGGDSIAIAQYGDNNLFIDCGGNELPTTCRVPDFGSVSASLPSEASTIYSAFFVENNELRCAGSRGSTVQTIATGIENIQYLYGIKNANNNSVERYVNATDINNQWGSVVSIQVGVLVRSKGPVKNNAEQEVFSLLDQKVTAPTDRYQRAVFTTTIRLRNVL